MGDGEKRTAADGKVDESDYKWTLNGKLVLMQSLPCEECPHNVGLFLEGGVELHCTFGLVQSMEVQRFVR